MAISESLLEILVCPETKTPVTLAGEDLMRTINGKISEGLLRNKAGQIINERLEAGLIREDGKVLYPIRDDIPIMLIDEAIEL